MQKTNDISNLDFNNHVSRRDVLAILLSTGLLPKFGFAQEHAVNKTLSKMDPETYQTLTKNMLRYKMQEMPIEGDQAIGALLKIDDILSGVDDNPSSWPERADAIKGIINSKAYISPHSFSGIPDVLGLNKSNTHVDQDYIDWASATYDSGVIVGGAAKVLSPVAQVGLSVAGLLIPPFISELNQKEEIPPSLTRAQLDHAREIVIDRAVNLANKQGPFKDAITSESFIERFKLKFSPSKEDLQNEASPAAKKILSRVDLTQGKTAEENEIAIQELKNLMREETEKLKALSEEVKEYIREQKEKERRQQLIEQVNYHTRELEGFANLAGFVADKVLGSPEAGKTIVTSFTAVSKMYQLTNQFNLGQIGMYGLTGGMVGIAGSLFSAMGNSTDKLILDSLNLMHEKIDELLKASQRIEQRQIEMLKALSELLVQMSEHRTEVRQRFAELKEGLDHVALDINQIAKENDIAEFEKQLVEARSLIKFPLNERDDDWDDNVRKVLISFFTFADIDSRKTVFTGNPTLIPDFNGVGIESVKRKTLDVTLGLLPQVFNLLKIPHTPAVSKYLGNDTPNVPNPNLWSEGTEAYLQLCVELQNMGKKHDIDYLKKLWDAGMDLRNLCMDLSNPVIVAKACNVFMEQLGVGPRKDPDVELAKVKVPKTTKHPLATAQAIARKLDHTSWLKNKSLLGVLYQTIHQFESEFAKYLTNYRLSPERQTATITKGKPGFLRNYSIETVPVGQYYQTNIPVPPGYLRSQPGYSDFLIKNDPIDIALELGAIKKVYEGDSPYKSKPFILVINFGPNAGKKLANGRKLYEGFAQIDGNITETSHGTKDDFYKSRYVEGLIDVRPLLNTCQKLVHEYIAFRLQTDLCGVIKNKFKGTEFGQFNGSGFALRVLAQLSNAKYQDVGSFNPKLNLSDINGIFDWNGILEYLSSQIKAYPTKDHGLALLLVEDLSEEIRKQCEFICQIAEMAPAKRSLPIVDATLWRLATYMAFNKIPIPQSNDKKVTVPF